MLHGWHRDYPDPAAFFGRLPTACDGQREHLLLLEPEGDRQDGRGESLDRCSPPQAWADLDAYLMRNDPPWAPFLIGC